MGWFSRSSGSSNGDTTAPKDSSSKEGKSTEFLEDLAPKFEDNIEAIEARREFEQDRKSTTLKEAWKSVKVSDVTHVSEIPCFRQSMLTGGAMAGVVFAVLVSTRSTYRRATNWAVLSFALGSVVSWEQCRYKMRKGLKQTAMAQKHYKEKSSKDES